MLSFQAAARLLGAAAVLLLSHALAAQAQTLRIAMTASDIPTTGGIPDNGGEGYRFVGYPIYDALVNVDFTHTDTIADVTPGLATEWHADPSDTRKWIFTLRKGVKFHDGTDFTADAAIWNLERIFNTGAAQYDSGSAPIVRASLSILDRYEKIDDDHIAIWTKTPFSPFYYLVSRILFVSPAQYAKVGGKWQAFMSQPAGTGPFKLTKLTPHVSAELTRNPDYWDKTRIPKVEKMVLFPMPESTTRLAALRSGQVDWIEVPPSDAIPSLKAAGFQISLKEYPHIWPWVLSNAEGSPFTDRRLRLALNYAVDREGIVNLLNGTAKAAAGFYDSSHVSFGSPKEHFTYNPEKAKALLREAGYGPDKPLKVKLMVSTSGSGQMQPLPMNEFLQGSMKPLGIDVEFDIVDWGTMLVAGRNPPNAPASHGDKALNWSIPTSDPTFLYRLFSTAAIPPGGFNWASYSTPEVDALMAKAFTTFEPAERDKLIGEAHARIVDDAAWVFIVHDLNPRAMSAKVRGFDPAQSWNQDFTQLTVAK